MPGFFEIWILVAVVSLGVLFFKFAGKKGLILIPVIIIGLVFVSYSSMRVSHSSLSMMVPDSGAMAEVQSQSAIWSDAVDDYFEADQYATMADAAVYLAHAAVKELKNDIPPSTPWVIYGRDAADSRTLNGFSDVVRTQLNLTDVRTEMAMPDWRPSDSNAIECILDVPRQSNRSTFVVNGLSLNNGTGTIRVRIENAPSPVIRTAEFGRKRWVNTLSELRNQSTSSLLVARSNSSCTDETEAQDQALKQAASMVQDLLRKSNEDFAILNQEITLTPQDLMTNQLVADQFSQSLRTSTARVWRHAVLLNLDPQRMQTLLQQKTRQIQRQHKTWAKDLLSLAGLALVVLILYIFLNAATKGYYVWSLRVFALVTLVGIVVVLLLV